MTPPLRDRLRAALRRFIDPDDDTMPSLAPDGHGFVWVTADSVLDDLVKTAEDPKRSECPGHETCERCDVTDPCPCCGLRYVDGQWVKADPAKDGLREQYADAIRKAAHWCDGDCGKSERECDDAHPIQVGMWAHGVVADVSGSPDALADALLTVRDREMERLRADLDQCRERFANQGIAGEEAAVQIAGLEAELLAARSTIDRVTAACDRGSAIAVRAALDAQR